MENCDLTEIEENCKRYFEEARRYRTEAQNYAAAARQCYISSQITTFYMDEAKKKWVTEGIPKPEGFCEYYGVGGNSYLMYVANSCENAMNSYIDALIGEGFRKYSEKSDGKVIFSCFENGKAVVNVSFSETDYVLRVVVESLSETELPPKDIISDTPQNTADPKIVLFGDHIYEKIDCGMGYIFRLRDGSFFIIDGAVHYPETIIDSFYQRLCDLSEGNPIVISAWIFTHAHHDHTRVFSGLAKKYGDKVEVRRIIHNFPGDLMLLGSGHYSWCIKEYEAIENAMCKYKNGKPVFIRAHSGQEYQFQNLKVDILFTLDDFKLPFFPENFNATSLIFRVTVEDQKFMFLGDADPTTNGILVERYGSLLKSDVVQVAHHGFYGGTKEVYDAIDAPIVLWPVPAYDPKYGGRRYVNPDFSPVTREMIKNHAKAVYLQWKGTEILSLPMNGTDGTTLENDDDRAMLEKERLINLSKKQ